MVLYLGVSFWCIIQNLSCSDWQFLFVYRLCSTDLYTIQIGLHYTKCALFKTCINHIGIFYFKIRLCAITLLLYNISIKKIIVFVLIYIKNQRITYKTFISYLIYKNIILYIQQNNLVWYYFLQQILMQGINESLTIYMNSKISFLSLSLSLSEKFFI